MADGYLITRLPDGTEHIVNGEDPRALAERLAAAAEPLPDEILGRWQAAVAADSPAGGAQHWHRLALTAAESTASAPLDDGPRDDERVALGAAVSERLDERYAAGGAAAVLAYAGACWLVACQRVTDAPTHALALLVDRRVRPELERVVGRTRRWLPIVERVEGRTRFDTLERAVAGAREVGLRWQELLPDGHPMPAVGLDVIVFDAPIVDAGGWPDPLPLTLRLVRLGERWLLDRTSMGAPPKALLAGWQHLLCVADTTSPLSELPLADPEPTPPPAPGAPDVLDAIERWQAERPGDVAVVDAAGELTIGELWHAAGARAAQLAPGATVEIRCQRDRLFAIAVVAALRAGVTFVPTDTDERANHAASSDAAYGMWTSGSLGEPKLALISRRTLAAATFRVAEFAHVSADDRYLHLASFGFSSSIRQLFVPLSQRAPVLITPEAMRMDAPALLAWLAETRPTIIDTTPTTLDALAEAGGPWPDSVRLVMTASEALAASVAERFRAATGYDGPHVHFYGTTETSGLVAAADSRAQTRLAPLPGCRLYVRDAALHPLPEGAAGELYVDAGPDAYHGATATALAFVPSPSAPGTRMFRTSDRARRLPDGHLEWLGRYDDLIKIRAERVSLTKVGEVAQAHPAVRRAYALDVDGEVGIAVAVTRGEQLSVEEMQAHLRAQGLHAGLPTRVTIVDQLPQNASGKLDRRAVRALIANGGDQRAPVATPATATEQALHELWTALLPDRTIGVTDNFFDLGGHSLKAAQLAARVRRTLQCEAVGVATVFDHPTIRALGAFVDGDGT